MIADEQIDLTINDKYFVGVTILTLALSKFLCNQSFLIIILNAIISFPTSTCPSEQNISFQRSGDMLGINHIKAVSFVQHLAACTGFCGNGIASLY